eukprot:9328941-Pyramimonas_sp.AAC.1
MGLLAAESGWRAFAHTRKIVLPRTVSRCPSPGLGRLTISLRMRSSGHARRASNIISMAPMHRRAALLRCSSRAGGNLPCPTA